MIDFFTELDTTRLIEYIKQNHDPNKPLVLVVDLFCGCGGVTEGFLNSEKNLFVVACVNHDEYAIKSHHANHPYCIHYTEDIRDWALIKKIDTLFKALRTAFPDAVVILHGSLECIHFSKAKGGMPRDADSRTLGNHLYKYLVIEPDYITIENVDEFRTWGPMAQVQKKGKWKASYKKSKRKIVWLDKSYESNPLYYKSNGLIPWDMPIPERKGEDYEKWIKSFENKGYRYDNKSLNAADFGAYTNRKRYFGVFAKNGFPIEFPLPTHISRKKLSQNPNLKQHKAVREVLDLENEGRSIFGLSKNGKPYCKATFGRVYHGLIKSWKEGWFMIRYNGGDLRDKNKSIEEPLGTILTNNTHSLVKPIFLTSYYGASKNGNGVHSLDKPCNTITTKDRFALHHLQYAYGNAMYSSVQDVAGPITTNPKHELVTQYLQYDYTNGGKGNHSSVDYPAGSITALPKHKLITAKWLYDTQFDRKGMSIDRPSPTIIASQDKKPLYIASATNNNKIDNSVWREDDDFIVMLLRTFMRQHNITDIKIRSLEIDELLRIQGFPEDYVLKGGKTRSMRYIGNSVCPPMAEALGKAIYSGIKKHIGKAA